MMRPCHGVSHQTGPTELNCVCAWCDEAPRPGRTELLIARVKDGRTPAAVFFW